MKIKNFLLMSLLTIFLFSCAPAPAQEIQIIQAEQREITVSGSGEVKVSPDWAEIILGIYTTNTDVILAKEENEEISRNVLDVLEENTIAEKDIKADYLGIFVESPEDSVGIFRYGVKNAFKVTVQDLTELEFIITEILKIERVHLTSVYFQVSDIERYQERARDLAIQAAKQEARNIAPQFGQEIDVPLSIQESSSFPESSIFYSSTFTINPYFYGGNAMSFREITIRSTVTVTYSLKPQ